MKNQVVLIFLIVMSILGCKVKKPVADAVAPVSKQEVPGYIADYSKPETWILGYFNPDLLKKPPHSEWFMKGYDGYQYNQDVVNKLTQLPAGGITIKVVLGTWCPDSRREVPRFMRILDAWKFPASRLTFIGVDNAKLSPVGEYESLNIQRVPTFIFYRNNVETGRIIENPVTSLEQDMVNILTKE